MTTDVKLLPCPFCGKGEHLQVEHLEGTVVHPAYRVSCDNCGASTGYTDTDCRKVWNERANMAELFAENERLRGEVEEVRYEYTRRTQDHYLASDACERERVRAERLAEAAQEVITHCSVNVDGMGPDSGWIVERLHEALDPENW